MIIDHMKPNRNFEAIFAGIVGITLIVAIVIAARYQWPKPIPAQRSDQPIHSAPPPGYTIETNGKEWKWKAGLMDQIWASPTRAGAVDSAWLQYNYDSEQQAHPWRLETPPTDPNAGLIQPVEPMPMIDNRSMYQPDPKSTLILGSGKGTP